MGRTGEPNPMALTKIDPGVLMRIDPPGSVLADKHLLASVGGRGQLHSQREIQADLGRREVGELECDHWRRRFREVDRTYGNRNVKAFRSAG